MGRSPRNDETGLKKGPWTAEEDEKLIDHIQKHGHGSWRALPKLAGLNRCGKSCRLRWTNYLRPDIKRGKFSAQEEQTILNLHSVLGNKWSTIATQLPGRTDNEIKNFWNTHLKKKLIQMGFDPMTHRPRTDLFASLPHLIALANLKELMEQQPWEKQALRLRTEAAQMAKLEYLRYLLQPPASMAAFCNNVNTNTVSDMETYNLLNSLSAAPNDSPVTSTITQSLQETPIPISTLPAIYDSSVPFSHLPDLQSFRSFQTSLDKDLAQPSDFSVLSHGKNSPTDSPWLHSSLSPSPPPAINLLASEPSLTNTGDACSTSSFEGAPSSSIWSDILLENPLFHEIALS